MDAKKWARFVVRPDKTPDGLLLLGKAFGGLFKPGVVYEVAALLDTFVIRECGKSLLGPSVHHEDMTYVSPEDRLTRHYVSHTCWGSEAGMIIACGEHLRTEEEQLMLLREAVEREAEDLCHGRPVPSEDTGSEESV